MVLIHAILLICSLTQVVYFFLINIHISTNCCSFIYFLHIGFLQKNRSSGNQHQLAKLFPDLFISDTDYNCCTTRYTLIISFRYQQPINTTCYTNTPPKDRLLFIISIKNKVKRTLPTLPERYINIEQIISLNSTKGVLPYHFEILKVK